MSADASQRIRQTIDRCRDASEVSKADILELDSDLSLLISVIAKKQSVRDAGSALLELGSLQELLSILLFRYGVELTDRQRKIVREYDRWDDEETRVRFFKEVTEGRV